VKKRILVLGSNGMLGSRVASILAENQDFELITTSRTETNSTKFFDAKVMSLDLLLDSIHPKFIINCIGINPHGRPRSFGNFLEMFNINTVFARKLSLIAEARNIKVIQPLTDGVFPGYRGGYSERSIKFPHSIYGISKMLGERKSKNQINLRCSLVGPELQGQSKSLFSWTISRPINSPVNGYANHYWNGITTSIFAKICEYIIISNPKMPPTLHVTPADSVTKFELLKLISASNQRTDLAIIPIKYGKGKDLRLVSIYKDENQILWNGIGFISTPTIAELIALS